MKITMLGIQGCFEVENNCFEDERGVFVKTYNEQEFMKYGICPEFKESYYSISKAGVVRGMHFQAPPFEHNKLVYVASGEILDVILDLRKNSATFKRYITLKLSENYNGVFIPIGCAHGFKSISDGSIVVYSQTSCYQKAADSGVLYNSFGFDWNLDKPLLSERDLSFKKLEFFDSPF